MFVKLGNVIKEDFDRLKHEFTVRSFFTVLFGLILLAGNAYLFFVSTIKMLNARYVNWTSFAFGLLGFSVSCLLIILITVHFSVTPQEPAVEIEETHYGGKKERVVTLILFLSIAFGGGGTALGFYIEDEIKYHNYPQTTATVIQTYSEDSDDLYTTVYEYTVGGKIYRAEGNSKSGGDAVPLIGETVSIRYNPLNPNEVMLISSESKVLLGVGCFLIFLGLAIIVTMLHNAKKLKTQFLAAFILLGLTGCIFTIYFATIEFNGLIAFFARNYILHFVLMFTNVGILELINGIVYIGYKNNDDSG